MTSLLRVPLAPVTQIMEHSFRVCESTIARAIEPNNARKSLIPARSSNRLDGQSAEAHTRGYEDPPRARSAGRSPALPTDERCLLLSLRVHGALGARSASV